ncbi:hypothetical protein LguiB_013075 [Lonicera macranthoides]
MQRGSFRVASNSSQSSGFLTSLLGVGCECEGYNVHIVRHSLGGSITTLLGLRVRAFSSRVMRFLKSML